MTASHLVPHSPGISLSGHPETLLHRVYDVFGGDTTTICIDGLASVLNKGENLLNPMPLYAHVSSFPQDIRVSHDLVGYPPNESPFNFGGAMSSYAFVRNAKALFTNWDDFVTEPALPKNENFVRKTGWNGQAFGGLSNADLFRQPGEDGSFTYATSPVNFARGVFLRTHPEHGYIYAQPWPFVSSPGPEYYFYNNIRTLRDQVEAGERNYSTNAIGGYSYKLSQFSFEMTGKFLRSVSYQCEDIFNHQRDSKYYRTTMITHKFSCDVIIPAAFVDLSSEPCIIDYDALPEPMYHRTQSSYVVSDYHQIYKGTYYDRNNSVPRKTFSIEYLGQISVAAYSDTFEDRFHDYRDHDPVVDRHYHNGRLSAFDQLCDHNIRELAPLNFLTTKDAIDGEFEDLEANHLETLSDLSDLAGVVDVVPNLVKFVKGLAKKDLVSLIQTTFDILTDAKLLYSFGIAPTIDDANEIASKGKAIQTKYNEKALFGVRTLHSKRNFLLPRDAFPGFPGVVCVARSKVRLSLDESTILAALLPANSLGLLPTLARAWDLIPGSFVADWKYRIGDRLSNVDSQLFMLGLNVHYCTHSLTVYHNATPDDEANYNFTAIDGKYDGLSTVKYYRYVSSTVPTLRDSKFDLLPAHGPPDWGVVGSLLYKVLS